MKALRWTLFLFALSISSTFAGEPPPDLDIYLLIGQSNMAGRAPVDAEDEGVVPRAFLFNEEGTWEPLRNPLNRYSTVRKTLSMQRLSLGYTFAQAMTEATANRTVGIVMNARGGTRIEEWAPGEELYQEAVLRAKAASEDGVLRGVLWHQGEGNSKDPDYLKKFSALVAALRADLDAPELPVVVGQVEGDRPVNALLAQVPTAVPHAAMASSAELTTYDGTHFDAASTREFGRRYAKAMKQLLVKRSKPGNERISLFDGETFAGWEGDTENMFRIANGAIVGGTLKEAIPHNAFLCTTREYRNFELELEFKLLGEQTNSGVQFRSSRIPDHHEVIGYQADLGDPHWWGSLYDESRRNRLLVQSNMAELNEVLRRQDWNHYRIRCDGDRIQLWINGLQTIDFTEEDRAIEDRGVVGLQIHGGPPGEAWFRNIVIRELPEAE